jgi:hypothetical protein
MIARSRVVPRRVSGPRVPPARRGLRFAFAARTCADLVATRALSAVIEVDMVNIVRACVRAGSADSDYSAAGFDARRAIAGGSRRVTNGR